MDDKGTGVGGQGPAQAAGSSAPAGRPARLRLRPQAGAAGHWGVFSRCAALLPLLLAGPLAAQSLGAAGGPGSTPLAWQACAQLPPGGGDEAEPPGSPSGDLLVGQVASVQGRAWLYDREQQAWLSPGTDAAWANWPLTQGDRLRTEPGARLTLRIASATVRLDGDSTLQLKRLAPDLVWLQLHGGQAAWHVPGDARARTLVLQADQLCARPLRAGHYSLQLQAAAGGPDRPGSAPGWAPAWSSIDRPGNAADRPWLVATTWRGELALQAPEADLRLPAGRQAAWLRPLPGARVQVQASQSSPFAEWALAQAHQDLPPPDNAELPETLSGAQALAAHGQWRDDPEWGRLWVPLHAEPGWAPYRDGRWTWRPSWGWTWVDAAPWGFVTVYYGRWVPWRGGWAWVPGHHHGGVHRPPQPIRPIHPGHPVPRPPPVFQPVPPGLTPPPHRPRPLPTPVQPGRPWLNPPGTVPGHERHDRPDRPDRPHWPDRGERGERGEAPDKPIPRVFPRHDLRAEPRPDQQADLRQDRREDQRQDQRHDHRQDHRQEQRPVLRPEPRIDQRLEQPAPPAGDRGTPWGRGRPGMDGGRPAWSHGGAPAQAPLPPAAQPPQAAPRPQPVASPQPGPALMPPPPAAPPVPVPRFERPSPPPAAGPRNDEPRERERERQRPAGPSAQQAR